MYACVFKWRGRGGAKTECSTCAMSANACARWVSALLDTLAATSPTHPTCARSGRVNTTTKKKVGVLVLSFSASTIASQHVCMMAAH